jgi:FtsH-binding integral membrane protein
VEPFFDLAYALVIFGALAVVGAIPGCLLGLAFPGEERWLAIPAVVLAFVGWIWFGWIESTYGISRLGLVLFATVGAFGFVRGWMFGARAGSSVRRRHAAR